MTARGRAPSSSTLCRDVLFASPSPLAHRPPHGLFVRSRGRGFGQGETHREAYRVCELRGRLSGAATGGCTTGVVAHFGFPKNGSLASITAPLHCHANTSQCTPLHVLNTTFALADRISITNTTISLPLLTRLLLFTARLVILSRVNHVRWRGCSCRWPTARQTCSRRRLVTAASTHGPR